MMQPVYADNAATTPLSATAFRAMTPYFTEYYGNPSNIYSFGRQAKKALENARETVAECLGAQPAEIFFTSGGSESDNWAVKGAAIRLAEQGKKHIVTTRFEHHAVGNACLALERHGYEITRLEVHEDGLVRPEELEAALRPDTALVSVMFANNEIGTIQPIAKIGKICKKHGVLFHTDAVQAAGHLPLDVNALSVGLLSISGHKFNGPKGVGALFIRRGTELCSLIDGGAQERGLRAGTENVAGAVGLAAALKEACEHAEENAARLTILRDRLIAGALAIEGSRLNGDPKKRLPGNVNVGFEGVEGETLVLLLDEKGVCASSGSACTAGSVDPSHVLLALGLPVELARGSLRLTLGNQNTAGDVERILEVLPEAVEKIRSIRRL